MRKTDELLARERDAREKLMARSSWGLWGPEDQRGALNYITPDSVRRAASRVRAGSIYPLGIGIRSGHGPVFPGRPVPQLFMMTDGGDFASGGLPERPYQFADDYLSIAPHGAVTHIDALCHVWSEHLMYNGFSGNLVRSRGAEKLGIENVRGVICRGVLLDVAGLHDVEVLGAEALIVADDLLGCMEKNHIAPIEAGDAVLVRTGWTIVYRRELADYSRQQPGLSPSAALTLADWKVSLIGCDNSAVEPISRQPDAANDLHIPLIRNLGIPLIEMLDLEQLAGDRVYDFMLCVAPLGIVGGTTSPLNPLAVS